MLSLTHTLISLPFAFWLDQPVIIFIAAFLFHFLVDSLFHWNIYVNQVSKHFPVWVGVDIIAGILVAWSILGQEIFMLSVIAAIAGGNAPDIIQALWDLLKPRHRARLRVLKPAFAWHYNLQYETNSPLRGLIWQFTLIVIAIFIVSSA